MRAEQSIAAGCHRQRVRVLYGEDGFVPNQPGQGKPKEYPWHLVVEAAAELVAGR
ncbi:hypothetical protein [Streptomyces sp. NPDC014805]|uniref:hypothetical protein n=1 Tax=Streptomyces sp. NPDC014805 TaxID=3364919 RepID=UPI003700C57C